MIYNKVTEELVARFKEVVGERNVLVEQESLIKYSHDESFSSSAIAILPEIVVKPETTDQVSKILILANKKCIPVTFRGQGTGLSSGATPLYKGIVMSFENMSRILEIDEDNLMAVVEPGVILLEFRQELEKRGLFYPADPGEPSSSLGGNVNTNAGGMNGIKYGNTRGYVLGLEAVIPSGKILNLGGKTIKRSTGYELMHLIIGSEGTLAAVTKITVKLIKLPKIFITLFIPFPNLRNAIESVPEMLRRKITPTAIEFFEREQLIETEKITGKTMPHYDAEAYLILRIDGDKEEEVYEVGEAVSEICMQNNAVDILMADTKESQKRIWDLRESLAEAVVQNRVVEMVDTVVPPSRIADYVEEVKKIATKVGLKLWGVGHAGDGNVHLHILKDELSDKEWKERFPKAMKAIYETAVAFGGTISGEHGIGLDKKDYFLIGVSQEELKLMKKIKRLFDPNNILNPGKIFDL